MVKSKASKDDGRVFKFITSDCPGPTKDPELRTIIRKQAMFDAGRARRLRGNHNRINLGTPVTFQCIADRTQSVESLPTPESRKSPTSDSDDEVDELLFGSHGRAGRKAQSEPQRGGSNHLWIDHVLSLNPRYDQARSNFGVELRALSLLTNFNTMKSRDKPLSGDPKRLSVFLRHRHWSYLEFVPALYDTNECVTAASDCVLAKVASILMPSMRDPEIEVRLYVRALRVLQNAIEDPVHQFDAETLCAVQLVSLRDLLDFRRDGQSNAWESHIRGCSKLIQRRGADSFKSEFEKALFAAHVGPTLSRAFRNDTPCYLESPEWTKLYRSLALKTDRMGHRFPMTIYLRSLMFAFPRLWRDIDRAMTGDDVFNPDALQALEERCRNLHSALVPCVKECTNVYEMVSESGEAGSERCHRRALLIAAADCLALVKRLLVAVCDSSRMTLEAEAQGLAQWIVGIVKSSTEKKCWIVNEHGPSRAQATVRTASEYAQAIACETWEERRLEMRKAYLAWQGLLHAEFENSDTAHSSGQLNGLIGKSVQLIEECGHSLIGTSSSVPACLKPLSYS